MKTEEMDEAVHEMKGQEAAEINNAGEEAQRAYLGTTERRGEEASEPDVVTDHEEILDPDPDPDELRLAAALVIKRWESGDLAGAVRNLDKVLGGASAPISTYLEG